MDADRPVLDIATAARTLGLTPDAVRKRLARGSLQGYKDERGFWHVTLDTEPVASGHSTADQPDSDRNGADKTVLVLEETVANLRSELHTKNVQISELHQLLARAALAPKQNGGGSLGPPNGTGRLDPAGHDSDVVLRDQLQAALAPSQTKRWWRFWL